jgi:two-component system sensor histidine kinase QseC
VNAQTSTAGKVIVKGSVRRRLLAMLLGGVALVWLGAAAVTAWETRSELQELLDAHLAQSASLLAAQVNHEVEEIEQEHTESLHKYASNVAFQIWARGDVLLLHSAGAPTKRLSVSEAGFADELLKGRAWRVFSVWDVRHEYLIQVGEAAAAREHLALEILEKLVLPLLVSLPLLGLLIWFAVGVSLKPIGRISNALAQRDPHYLAPIEGETPAEIAPMVERLNHLLERVRASLDNERRFTSDAAHELRTPLAGLKTQLQVAQGAVDAAGRKRAMDNAMLATDRATRLVEQLLMLARLEHDAWQSQAESVRLHQIAAQVLAEAAPAAAEKHIQLALSGSPETQIRGHAGLLAVLLRNLVDNALRYSPSGSGIEVTVSETEEGAKLEVLDQGPGIPVAERELAMRRFHRLGGESSSGSGLGLSIVARIAQLHNAKLELLEGVDGRGLRAVLKFRK